MSLFKDFRFAGFLSVLLFVTLPTSALARDMSGRLGVGFINSFVSPAFSLKYGLSKDNAVLAAFGFNTAIPTVFNLAGKFYKNLFYEQNMNFYSAFAVAMLKNIKPGFEIQGTIGAEFFIPGIESLGFAFESGVSATNATNDSFAVKTVGFTFLHAGVHFYF